MDNMFVRPKKMPKAADKQPLKASPAHTISAANLEPAFIPPEEVANIEERLAPNKNTEPPKPPKKASWWKRTSKNKKLAILIPAAVVFLGGGGATAFILTHKKPVVVLTPAAAADVAKKIEEPPKPTTVASKLTGVQVAPALNDRGVTGVMIENSLDARPQSGLQDAGVVYEAIAEGGITRFLALFQEGQPAYIGPVRSARPYYIDWLLPYSATYAHVGGSPEALQMIENLKIKDMNEFANANTYERVSSRFAPHNAYTSMAKLDALRTAKKWGNDDFTGFARKADSVSKAPTATTVDIALSSAVFNVRYDYDAATNSYKRSEGGKAHTDEKSSKQLTPKVVVVLVIPYSIHPDGVHTAYKTTGKGQAFVFQDGIKQDATWVKNTQNDPLSLQGPDGQSLKLNAGQTWVTAAGLASMVSFTPPAAIKGTP